MQRKEHLLWVAATVVSLGAFSFFAGLGIRGLHDRVTRTAMAPGRGSYPLLASAAPRVPEPDMAPGMLYNSVLQKLQLYYVEELPPNTTLSIGSAEAMLNALNDPNTRLMSREEVDALRAAAQGEFSGLGAVLTVQRYGQGAAGDEVQEPDMRSPMRAPGAPPGPAAPPRNPGVRTLTIVSVMPGGPAEKAGLQAGDRIIEIDGRWIAPIHLSFRQIAQMTDDLGPQDGRPLDPEEPIDPRLLNDPERKRDREEAEKFRARWKNATELPQVIRSLVTGREGEVTLTIERGRPARKITAKVQLAQSRIPVFASRKLETGAGYLRLQVLSEETRRLAEGALAEFGKDGTKELVVDLRDSPGGSLEATREIAGLFYGEGKLAVLKERDSARKLVDRPVMSVGKAVFRPAGVKVLVNRGTAGSSEVLAAALRDHLGAVLVGENTFGDGQEQELLTLENGAGISITRARMLTSKGVEFDGKGLKPDQTPQGDALVAVSKGA